MFAQHSVHVNLPIEEVTSALAEAPEKWFPRLDSSSRAAVGPEVAGVGLRKKVDVEVGKPVTLGDWIEIPVTWQATSIKQLFPVMTGRVELVPIEDRVTRLTVCGMYEPPLGSLGKQLDDALMYKVAKATVKDLAESIAKQLESGVRLS